MSVTTSGPATPVDRRMIPSGEENLGASRRGVTHPFTHALAASPRRGGGDAGRGGGGTAVVEPVGDSVGRITAEAPLVGWATPAPGSHAEASAIAMATIAAVRKLGM
jgi:hypothetical protein